MTRTSHRNRAHPAWNMPGSFLQLMLVSLLSVSLALAAPPAGRGDGNGGGGGDIDPQPGLHLKWRVHMDGPCSRPVPGPNGTVYAVDVYDHLVAVAPVGTVKWRADDVGSRDVDVGPDGTIYCVVSSGMGVFSLEDTGGAGVLRWTNPEAYDRLFIGYVELAFGPTADGRDQQLYFTANRHTRAVRLSDGASMFSISGGNGVVKFSQSGEGGLYRDRGHRHAEGWLCLRPAPQSAERGSCLVLNGGHAPRHCDRVGHVQRRGSGCRHLADIDDLVIGRQVGAVRVLP